MKKPLIAATFLLVSNAKSQTNLLQNSDFESQGVWLVNQCDANGAFTVSFGVSGITPTGGSGKAVELAFESDGSSTAEVFVYQPVKITPGHAYKVSGVMLDLSLALTDSWIEIAYVTAKPVANTAIDEVAAIKFGTWQACNGVGFDGALETSCGAIPEGGTNPSPYFHIPDTTSNDTIYVGIDVGTWYTTCNLDFAFDNITLIDSLEAGGGTGIKDLTLSGNLFDITPNPSMGLVSIRSIENTDLRYRIYNSAGTLITSGIITSSASLDLSNWNKGVYYIQVVSKNATQTRKLLLQ